jgi:uncharacterized protein (TIGR03437 family)
MYCTSLVEGSVIPPYVSIGGRMADLVFFGDAPGYPGYYQVNFRVPVGLEAGAVIPVRLNYLDRPSNDVTLAIQ